jgi:hypothetical protein
MQFHLPRLVTGEIQFTKDVTTVATLDGILTRREESLFVLTTEYFHFGCSLRLDSRPQALHCSTHKPQPSSGIVRGDGEMFLGRVLLRHDYPKPIQSSGELRHGVGRRGRRCKQLRV